MPRGVHYAFVVTRMPAHNWRLLLTAAACGLTMLALLLGCSANAPTPRPEDTLQELIQRTSPETDREALVALLNATNRESWADNDNWLSSEPLGEWEGVEVDTEGRVVVLTLSGNQLVGEMPPQLGNLAGLEWLDLNDNNLSGEIPPELGNLVNLRNLSLSGNQLSGEIPPELGNLVNLRNLTLSGNQLSGEIPPELGNLVNLRNLCLSDNQLSGEIPPSWTSSPFWKI